MILNEHTQADELSSSTSNRLVLSHQLLPTVSLSTPIKICGGVLHNTLLGRINNVVDKN